MKKFLILLVTDFGYLRLDYLKAKSPEDLFTQSINSALSFTSSEIAVLKAKSLYEKFSGIELSVAWLKIVSQETQVIENTFSAPHVKDFFNERNYASDILTCKARTLIKNHEKPNK